MKDAGTIGAGGRSKPGEPNVSPVCLSEVASGMVPGSASRRVRRRLRYHAARSWGLPRIENLGELAQWLSIRPEELEWFADLKALGNKLDNAKLQHYRYRIIRKRSGGVRVIESPKPRLKEMQRRILAEILDRVPVHPAVHGFVKGRSIVTFAEALAGKSLGLREIR